MRIRIESHTRRGLRIIEDIPDNALGKIEGYNGIGKTNAIKLLRLCTGDQPFQDEASWQSFRDHLAHANVEITGLQGAKKIEFDLDPTNWLPLPEPPGRRLGRITVDGASADHDAIRSLLKVHHIFTAETPLDVLKDRISQARRTVVGWVDTLGAFRQQQLDVKLGEIQKLLRGSLPAQLQLDINADQEARRFAEDATVHLANLKKRTTLLEEAVDVSEKLGQVRGRGSEMDLKIRDLERDIAEIDAKRAEIDRQIAELSERQHSNKQAERAFNNAQKFVVAKGKALREVTQHFESSIAAANVTADKTSWAPERATLEKLLQTLVDQLPQVNATPMLIAILESLADRLVEAERHDLGNATLIDPTVSRPAWTVHDLREACLQQAGNLSRRAPSAEAQELASRITETRNRISALARAESVLEQLEQAKLDFERAEGRLRNAARDLPAQTAQTLDTIMENRNGLDDQGRAMQAEHARLSHARELLGGGMTEEALAAQLITLSRAAGADPARIRGQLDQIRGELDSATKEHAIATQKSERAARALNDHVISVRRVVADLQESPKFTWLRSAFPEIDGWEILTATEQASAIEHLEERIGTARSNLASVLRNVQAIGRSFGGLYDWLSQRTSQTDGLEQVDVATRLWLADQVRLWFQDPVVSDALFDSSTDVRLDWQDLTVHWTVNGEPRNRPLINFSSGEQTFAYTHAQLAQLERTDDGVANRLIALDEFGSFLDTKRMQNLIEYLKERVQRIRRDQIVVILPLESASMISSQDGTESRSSIRELELRGYISQSLM
ncbi:hypothetical protein HH310_27110 [Actinoplanes sp. TBRC 11911]|uniref:hypothetical protein n=1 Tax=Actinoplanes sp. TBRC 11911 TaxID=2729386 RepID=UPI00145D273D|nr:hypothetical protein [Actinoplanes sp. TBRC 11911]NMO54840.1 hypothetical protein [Actinoplanes sp. TBRC 11911]